MYNGHDCIRNKHNIFNRYIVFSLIDAMIVGTVNAIFMAAFGMEYIGLISFIIAVANLIPDFGPIIGTVLAAFIFISMGNRTLQDLSETSLISSPVVTTFSTRHFRLNPNA